MKVSKEYLQQVIKEEMEKVLEEEQLDEIGGAFLGSMASQIGGGALKSLKGAVGGIGDKIKAGAEKVGQKWDAAKKEAGKAQLDADTKALVMKTAQTLNPAQNNLGELAKKAAEMYGEATPVHASLVKAQEAVNSAYEVLKGMMAAK